MGAIGSLRKQFLYTKIPLLTQFKGRITFGSSGAISSVDGEIQHATKLATGLYEVAWKEGCVKFLGLNWGMRSPLTGSNVNDGSFVVNTLYQIQTPGTTKWNGIGLASGFVGASGMTFVATSSSGLGNGVVKAIGKSGIVAVEVAQLPETMVNAALADRGLLLNLQTLSDLSTLASPAAGSILDLEVWAQNSSASSF